MKAEELKRMNKWHSQILVHLANLLNKGDNQLKEQNKGETTKQRLRLIIHWTCYKPQIVHNTSQPLKSWTTSFYLLMYK